MNISHMPNLLSGKSGAVFAELESRFAKGYYKFGERLSQAELAEEFNVSLQPMRAALGQLRAQGFIIITPQVGCRVVSPSVAEISDFFLMFARMEGVTASLAAERFDISQLTVLEQVFEQLIDCPMPQKGLAKDYAKLVRIWHHTVRQMAHSPSLDWRISSFWNMADFLLWQTAPLLGKTQIEIANKQRDQIMQAIRERDAKRSEELMFNHVFSKPSRVGILPEESTNR